MGLPPERAIAHGIDLEPGASLPNSGLYRKIVIKNEDIMHSLHQITKAKRDFEWGTDKQDVFDLLKHNLCTSPILAILNLHLPFEVEADASGHALGAVLTQQGKLVTYHLESFLEIVQKYNTYHKETYAIV